MRSSTRLTEFQRHDRFMRNFQRGFWVFFFLILAVIVGGWALIGTAAYKGIKCAGDEQCLHATGKQVGSFVHGLQEGAEGK